MNNATSQVQRWTRLVYLIQKRNSTKAPQTSVFKGIREHKNVDRAKVYLTFGCYKTIFFHIYIMNTVDITWYLK